MNGSKKNKGVKFGSEVTEISDLRSLFSISEESREYIVQAMGEDSPMFARNLISLHDPDEEVFLRMLFLPAEIRERLVSYIHANGNREAVDKACERAKKLEDRKNSPLVSPEDETARIEIPERRNFDLAGNYANSVLSLSLFDVIDEDYRSRDGDAPYPSLDDVSAKMTPEILRKINSMKTPVLLLVPDISVESKIFLINNRQKKGETDLRLNLIASDLPPYSQEKEHITSWRSVVVEGGIDLTTNPDELSWTIAKRVNNLKSDGVLDLDTYLTFLMWCVERGQNIDRNCRTFILSDDNSIMFSLRYLNQVVIRKAEPTEKNHFTYFRDFIVLGDF